MTCLKFLRWTGFCTLTCINVTHFLLTLGYSDSQPVQSTKRHSLRSSFINQEGLELLGHDPTLWSPNLVRLAPTWQSDFKTVPLIWLGKRFDPTFQGITVIFAPAKNWGGYTRNQTSIIINICWVWMELTQLWRPEFELDGISSGSWYHCLPIGIYHWLGEAGCIAAVYATQKWDLACHERKWGGTSASRWEWSDGCVMLK